MSEIARNDHVDDAVLQQLADEPDGERIPAADFAHIASCSHCQASLARVRVVAAALALTSAAPPSLSERVMRRREASELVTDGRVTLPVPPSGSDIAWQGPARDAAPRSRPRRRAAVAAAAALTAAAAALALYLAQRARPASSQPPGVVVERETLPPSPPPPSPESTPPGRGGGRGAPPAARPAGDPTVAYRNPAGSWVGAIVARRTMSMFNESSVDSLANATVSSSAHAITITYSGESPAEPAARELAARVAAALERRGVTRARIVIRRAAPGSALLPAGSVEVAVIARGAGSP